MSRPDASHWNFCLARVQAHATALRGRVGRGEIGEADADAALSDYLGRPEFAAAWVDDLRRLSAGG